MNRKFWLVCYDVRDERRLRRVAKTMERYGQRVQKSVFECWLTKALLKQMHEEINKVIDEKKDSVRFYTLCKECRGVTDSAGKTKIQPVRRYYVV